MRTYVANNYRLREEAKHKLAGDDSRGSFTEKLSGLYQLSFLLTRNHEKAGRCFVAGVEHLVRGNRAFSQWAHSWARRIIIENAIRELKPQPRPSRSPSSTTDFPYIGQLSTPPGGHFEVRTILELEDFERFVFVMSVLDHYSEHDCALFLDCSVLQIREACTRALEKLIDSFNIASFHNEVFTQERSG